jgi:O-antigen/teichoic acid export membrane protein
LSARILIIAGILGALSILFNSLLFIQNKEKTSLYIIIFSACFNVLLNFILIPKFSFYGAAWATVIAEGVNLFLLQYFILVFINALIMLSLKTIGELNNEIFGACIVVLDIFFIFWLKLLTKEDLLLFFNPIINKFNNIFKSEEII